MSSPNSLYPYDKDELLHTLERFDGEITGEDEVDSIKHDNSRYIHTSFLEVLLECICGSFVRSDAKRQILLNEICRRLSESKLINEELLFHTLPLRKQLSKMFFDFIKKVCEDVIPDADVDFSNIAFLEENCSSFDNVYRTYFDELKEIGRGGFGVVCMAKSKMNNTLYAVKKIHFNYKNDSRLRRVIREAKNISLLNHPNVVHYDNAWTESPSPEDEFDYSSSDSEDNCSNETLSSGGKTILVKKDMLYSSESTFFSRSDRSNKMSLKRCKDKSSNNDSSFILFSESFETSANKIAWSFGSDGENESIVPNSDSPDSEKSDESVNWNVKAVLYIQMEYCDCDLRHWLDERAKGNPLPFEMNVTDMLVNILNGVAHIHSKCIIHRDLKPQNIFYSKSSNTLKIGDFGLATLVCCPDNDSKDCISNFHSANIGTVPYAAPEQIKYQSYDIKVDIYSLGIILIELLNCFSTVMELSKAINEIKKGEFPKEMDKSPKLINLVKNLINESPDERMSAKEILSYLQEDAKGILKAREIAVQEKEIFLNKKETKLQQKEIAINEKCKEIARLKETENEQIKAVLSEKDEEIANLLNKLQKCKEIARLKETETEQIKSVLNEKDKEVAKLKALVNELQNIRK